MLSVPSPSFLKNLRACHLIGAGGVGVGALGEILLDAGIEVSGSDLLANPMTRELCQRGAQIACGHAEENLPPAAQCVIYSNAASADNPELLAARQRKIPCFRRGEFLAGFAALHQTCIAVSGSHGKTSITAMIVHLLKKCGKDCSWMIGGEVPNLSSGHAGNGGLFVTEADESDGSHAALVPAIGVIPNADDDHAWSVGGADALQQNFRTFARQSKILVTHTFALPKAIWEGHPALHDIPLCGDFVRDNAELALEAVRLCGGKPSWEMLADFPGVERRMNVRFSSPKWTLVEDYAHAPAELRATLQTLRSRWQNHHLRVLFQPHRAARLERYFDEFAELLRGADSCFVAPLFAAWCESSRRSSGDLAQAIGGELLAVLDETAAKRLKNPPADGRPLLLAVIGAGDVNQILPFLAEKGKR